MHNQYWSHSTEFYAYNLKCAIIKTYLKKGKPKWLENYRQIGSLGDVVSPNRFEALICEHLLIV